MIKFNIIFGRVLLLLLCAGGLWLLGQAVVPAQESAARTLALSAYAPAAAPVAQGAAVPDGGVVEPVAVDLMEIPPNVYDPDNQYDRWLRGEIDLDDVEGIVSDAALAALRAEAMALAPDDDIQQADHGPGLSAPTAGLSFPSIDINGCCGGGANVPPDPELAVGPNHVIAAVNVAFEIYNTAGTSLAGPITFASFMSVDPNCSGVFDPNVLYDEQMDRYILAIDANGAFYCVAVSQTNNPLGAYWIYSFPTGNGSSVFFDYPHAGVGNDALFMGANIFNLSAGGGFIDSRVYAMDKNQMYVGGAAGFIVNNLGNTQDTPQPMNLHGFNQGTWPSSLIHSILTETNYNGANHTLFQWNGPFNGPNTFGAVSGINLNTATGVVAGAPINVPQSGGGTMQANDWRPQDFEYRNGYAWTTATIACNPGGGTVDCVRWAQIDVTTTPGAIGPEGAGVYASNGVYRFFADLAVNHCDDMAIGYTKSNSSSWPGIWVNGRESGVDAPGTLQSEVQMKAGEIAYTAFDAVPRRWGDYTGMTIAPDGLTFWYLGQYSKITGNANGRWGTYIGSYAFPNCTLIPTGVGLKSVAAAGDAAAAPWPAIVALAALTLLLFAFRPRLSRQFDRP